MRKRNQVVFSMLEAEAEYVQQLHILVNNFLRPLRMAASSKKPPITHDDVSSIFLNSTDNPGQFANLTPGYHVQADGQAK
ncbi:ras-specific guanine nucleotide-releasing factor 1 [Tachysurus ichikawai]